MAQDKRIALRNVSVRRLGQTLLGDVSLDVPPGSAVALLSDRPDCGRAVLAVLAGVLTADTGSVIIGHEDATRLPISRRHLAWIPRDLGLEPKRSVLWHLKSVSGQRNAPACLDAAGLRGMAHMRAGQLDRARQVRLAIARATVARPRALLLDDVVDHLGEADAEAVLGVLSGLAQDTPVMLVIKNPRHAMVLGGRTVVMAGGRVVQDGPCARVYAIPASLASARMTGPVACFPGRRLPADPGDEFATVALDGGPVVEAYSVDVVEGDVCVVGIRPERLAVADAAADDLGEGAVPARLERVEDRGDHLRLTLVANPDGKPVRCLAIRPAFMPQASLRQGKAVSLAWEPQHAFAFAASAAEAAF